MATQAKAQDLAAWLIVVPARLGSSRLPRKPLQDLGGKPLIVRVVQNLAPLQALKAKVIVATDAIEVRSVCIQHQIEAVLTKDTHESGTDRSAEAAARLTQPFILNVQGDEPFVAVSDLEKLMVSVMTRPEADMGTLVVEQTNPSLAQDPNAVKAIRSTAGWALYFSRAALPYNRDARERHHLPERFWHHLGVYAFRRPKLKEFVELGPSPLEKSEKLEQLRALEAGWRVWLEPATRFARGIDTPEDLEAARGIIAGR